MGKVYRVRKAGDLGEKSHGCGCDWSGGRGRMAPDGT